METVYEKVCPSCGRSATLAAKFCSGCGHQYRTVFHDNGPTDNGASQIEADPETNLDLRFAPVVALLPVLFVVLFFGSRPTPPVQYAQVQPIATSQGVPIAPGSGTTGALPQFGEQPLEVQAALGRPMPGSTNTDWYYPYNGKMLQVHFNDRNVVEGLTQYQ
jgi:hypothetical protein